MVIQEQAEYLTFSCAMLTSTGLLYTNLGNIWNTTIEIQWHIQWLSIITETSPFL